MTSIYDSIRSLLNSRAGEEYLTDLRDCGLTPEAFLCRLAEIPPCGPAAAAIASECVLREDGDWRFCYELLPVPLETILALPELPAVRELEEHGFASILAGRESLSQGDFTLAELRLFQPDTAFRLLREIPVSRRALLTEVLTAHLPTDLSPAPGAYLHALDLGLNSMVYRETALYAFAEGLPAAPLRAEAEGWEEDNLAAALWELRDDAPWAGYEENGLEESEERELASLAALYNALNLYRHLRYVKEVIEKARFYLRAFDGLEALLPEKTQPETEV